MTRAAIRKAFERLDTAQQAELLGALASTFAKSLADIDSQDSRVFDARRREEGHSTSLNDVARRLGAKKRRRG